MNLCTITMFTSEASVLRCSRSCGGAFDHVHLAADQPGGAGELLFEIDRGR